MSSLIGHSLMGLSLSRLSKNPSPSWQWSLWLIFLAISPDLNYIALWIFGSQGIFSYSHSIGFASVLPVLSILYLKYKNSSHLAFKSFLLFGTSFSHLLLDALVGVFPKPYFWPFYKEKLNLPFGILPSAGKLDLQNFYLYKNLLIELGILVPLILGVYVLSKRPPNYLIKLFMLLSVWIPFLIWGVSLNR